VTCFRSAIRSSLNCRRSIDRQTEPVQFKVTAVEVKDVGAARHMKRAWPSKLTPSATRPRQVANAEGEFQAAGQNGGRPPPMISKEPSALQLRFLQTMREFPAAQPTTFASGADRICSPPYMNHDRTTHAVGSRVSVL